MKLLVALMPNRSKYEPGIRISLVLTALAAMILALARPWGGVKNQETTRQGIEIVIAVDASNSMLASATENENGIDRMRTSKLFLEKLINRLSNDRVGLIAYAGDAYTLIPVTNDYVSAKTFLNSIDPSMIPYQGTNIGAAIQLAAKSFSQGDTGKAIILLTDADELENPEGVLTAVDEAAKKGIQTDVIGIGSVPVTIPSATQGRMKDPETGEVVRTALNEDLALKIAEEGKGIYVNASNADALEELMKQVGKLKKSALESSFLVTHDELYVIFVIIALVVLVLNFILTDRKNTLIDKMSLFRKGNKAVMFMAFLLCVMTSCDRKGDKARQDDSAIPIQTRNDSILARYSLPEERELTLRGINDFMGGRFAQADSAYQAAMAINPASVVAPLNAGLAYITDGIMQLEAQAKAQNAAGTQGEAPADSLLVPYIQKADEMWQRAAAPLVEKGNVSSKAYYNLGNVAFLQEQYAQAIDAYKNALRLNPEDDHARRNLRIAQLKKQEQDQDKNQQQQQQNQDQQQQQEQQQQQPQPQNINEQTSQQILDAAERKENQRRMQQMMENENESGYPMRPSKNW